MRDPETLVLWREAMKQESGARNDLVDNINLSSKGTSRSYTEQTSKRGRTFRGAEWVSE